MDVTTCECMPEYAGPCEVATIQKVECLDCGFVTTDHYEILQWNGYGDGIGCREGCTRSRWTFLDGTVTDCDSEA